MMPGAYFWEKENITYKDFQGEVGREKNRVGSKHEKNGIKYQNSKKRKNRKNFLKDIVKKKIEEEGKQNVVESENEFWSFSSLSKTKTCI